MQAFIQVLHEKKKKKICIRVLVRFYADYRIKQHASLRLLRGRLIFLFSLLQVYSQGGMVNVFTSVLILT